MSTLIRFELAAICNWSDETEIGGGEAAAAGAAANANDAPGTNDATSVASATKRGRRRLDPRFGRNAPKSCSFRGKRARFGGHGSTGSHGLTRVPGGRGLGSAGNH